ncbi:hypothetical protein [Flavobacterium alkalisoli]|uniref:hypothetical protein n=1 Tax=Flavobacterium alkalisoli TaxID=2602769 RepID=UPI00143CD8F0|nr:hypothetical protein [Flavobacterium alkalisoli]
MEKSKFKLWTVIQVLFIALKLTELIDWNWGWVLSPIWMPFVAALLLTIAVDIAEKYD